MLVDKLCVIKMIESVLESSIFSKCTDAKAVTAVSNLLFNVQSLDGVPSHEVVDLTRTIQGGLVLSPLEVEVAQCFASAWDEGDDRSLYGNLCYQDAIDLMARLKVDGSGVRGLCAGLDPGDEDRVDEDEFLSRVVLVPDEMGDIDRDELDALVQHFEDLNPGVVRVTSTSASLAERRHTAYMLDSMGFDGSVIDVTTPDDPVWNQGTPMPVDYTCCCGMYVHPSRINPKGIHLDDCPYKVLIIPDEPKSSNFLDRFGPFEG